MGVTTLPLDLDIFLRSGSTMKPEMAASVHGSALNSIWARTTVEKSQVRMMSWPCGRRSIGNSRANEIGVVLPAAPRSAGVSEEVAQVSMTSGSAMNPPGWSRWSAV